MDDTKIVVINDNTSGKDYGKFTEQVVVISQQRDGINHDIILTQAELEELEKAIGAKFKA